VVTTVVWCCAVLRVCWCGLHDVMLHGVVVHGVMDMVWCDGVVVQRMTVWCGGVVVT
jgi:hypothetical protein